MLYELRVENLLLLERAELSLASGLNVLTGETGAGKTLLAHALDLLLGGRARTGIVRGGAPEAYVEGVFSLPRELAEAELLPAGAEEIVLARRVWPDGRTRAYVCGRSATVADLRELGGWLLAFYGQHEHRKLMLARAQLDVLDAFCGPRQGTLREQLAAAHGRVRELEERARELERMASASDRELDLLAFELDEIEAAAPSEQEASSLAAERERLRQLDRLRAAAAAGAEAVSPDREGGAAELLAQAARALQSTAAIDPALSALADRLQALRHEAEDVGRELRSYAFGVDAPPGRLEEVEERLALLARLERKHGGSIEEVLRHAERCRRRIAELEHADAALEGVQRELDDARGELERLACALTERRRRAAPELARLVRERLRELAMPDARFEVEVRPRREGCGPRGADAVEFVIAPNPGVPGGPLKDTASGGELSRVMLALLSAAHARDRHGGGPDRDDGASGHGSDRPLLVFDEIDAGIGGYTARAVGEHLRELAAERQILAITHLPQVAALAARHFTIVKEPGTVPARTTVAALERDQVVGELVRMLGASDGDRAAREHARALLARAA